MNKQLRIFLALAALLLPASLPSHAGAEVVTITKSYTYTASAFDSMESSRVIAFAKLRLIIFNAVAGRVSTIDEAAVLAPGIVPVQEGRQRWDGRDYEMEASVSIDPEALFSALKALEADPQRADEFRDLRKREAEALSQIEVIKKEDDLRQYIRYDDLVRELAAVDAMERGYSALATRSYPAAVKYFAKAIELNPEDAAAYYNRGAADWLLENYGKAVSDFRKALDLRTGYDRAAKSLAQAEEYFDRVKTSIEHYDRAIAANPAEVGLYYDRGLAHWEMGNYNEAIRDFTMVVRLSPGVEDGYINRGGVYLTVEDYGDALNDFEAAIRLNPRNPTAQFNLGLVYIKLNRFEDAVRSFGHAIEINPSDTEALFNRGILYNAMGKTQKATADMQAAARLGHRGAREFLVSQGVKVSPGKAAQGKTSAPKEKPAQKPVPLAEAPKAHAAPPAAKPEVAGGTEVMKEPGARAEATQLPAEETVEVAAIEDAEEVKEPEAPVEEAQPLAEKAVEIAAPKEAEEEEPQAPTEAAEHPSEKAVEVEAVEELNAAKAAPEETEPVIEPGAPAEEAGPPVEEAVVAKAVEKLESMKEPEVPPDNRNQAVESAPVAVPIEIKGLPREPDAPEEKAQPPVENAEIASVEEPETAMEPETSAETASEVAEEAGEELKVIAAPPSGPIYAVQAGAFSNLRNADAFVVKLKKRGYPSYAQAMTSRTGRTFFLVLIGRYDEKQRAERMVVILKESEKMDSFVTVVK